MKPSNLKTPVVMIIFNRADTTRRLMAEIAKARPSNLLVIADGPRPGHPEDVEKCRIARDVVSSVDWDCEVLTSYSETNLGVTRRVATGLDWVFSQVPEAIILEDDCIPHPSFFKFCEELLQRYRDDERVMMIGGNNFGPPGNSTYSYSFIRYIGIWGWATWARSWQHFDLQMRYWAELRNTGWLQDLLGDRGAAAFWSYILDIAAKGKYPAWDYQWMFSCWTQNALSIMPSRNLVSNVGYGAEATNTKTSESHCDSLPVYEMQFPLRHPLVIARNRRADDYLSKHIFRCYRWLYGGRLERMASKALRLYRRALRPAPSVRHT